MPKFIVTAATEGRAYCEVEAESIQAAIEEAIDNGDWVHEEWDLNTKMHRGGWIDAIEAE